MSEISSKERGSAFSKLYKRTSPLKSRREKNDKAGKRMTVSYKRETTQPSKNSTRYLKVQLDSSGSDCRDCWKSAICILETQLIYICAVPEMRSMPTAFSLRISWGSQKQDKTKFRNGRVEDGDMHVVYESKCKLRRNEKLTIQ
jgi:hypothetical protein